MPSLNFYNKTSHCPLKVGTHGFEGMSPLWPHLPGKAIKLFFFCVQTFSHVRLCDPMDYNLPGSSIRGILQARTLEWVAISSYRGWSDPVVEPMSLALASRFFTTSANWEAHC